MTPYPHPNYLGVSADWMRATTTMPAHCARHGLPAVRWVDLALQSRLVDPTRQVIIANPHPQFTAEMHALTSTGMQTRLFGE